MKANCMCWHYDQTTGKNVKRVNILSALIQSGEFATPIASEWVKKMVTYGDPKTKKVQRTGDRSQNEIFRDLIDQSIKNGLK